MLYLEALRQSRNPIECDSWSCCPPNLSILMDMWQMSEIYYHKRERTLDNFLRPFLGYLIVKPANKLKYKQL
jgi:hypothetical protein